MATKAKTVEQTPNENDINLLNLLNDESEVETMSETNTAQNYERIMSTAKTKFLNTTPKETTAKWNIIGVGITANDNSYGAKTADEHWIFEKNERHSVDGYALASDVEQTAYKGDGVFEFIDELMYRMKTGTELETQMLEVFKYKVDESASTPKYDARLFTVLIVPDTDTLEGGSALKIKYKIQVQGDPTFGKVTFTNGVPTFTGETAGN